MGEGFGKKVTNFKTITNLTERKGFNYLQIMSSRAPCAFLSREGLVGCENRRAFRSHYCSLDTYDNNA